MSNALCPTINAVQCGGAALLWVRSRTWVGSGPPKWTDIRTITQPGGRCLSLRGVVQMTTRPSRTTAVSCSVITGSPVSSWLNTSSGRLEVTGFYSLWNLWFVSVPQNLWTRYKDVKITTLLILCWALSTAWHIVAQIHAVLSDPALLLVYRSLHVSIKIWWSSGDSYTGILKTKVRYKIYDFCVRNAWWSYFDRNT
jgi:hypothetical protein